MKQRLNPLTQRVIARAFAVQYGTPLTFLQVAHQRKHLKHARLSRGHPVPSITLSGHDAVSPSRSRSHARAARQSSSTVRSLTSSTRAISGIVKPPKNRSSTTLAFATITISDAGSYDCLITTTCGSVVSTAAPLTVRPDCCDSVDFNNNTVFPEDQDVIDFFIVLAGGGCSVQ